MAEHLCPPWVGYLLLNPLRRLLENPDKMLGQFVQDGMVVLEPGCGMGYFTLPLARMVGPEGRSDGDSLRKVQIPALCSDADQRFGVGPDAVPHSGRELRQAPRAFPQLEKELHRAQNASGENDVSGPVGVLSGPKRTQSLPGRHQVSGGRPALFLAPLYLMCSRGDLGVSSEAVPAGIRLPTIFIYDQAPGGVGYSAALHDRRQELLAAARELVTACPCERGCPACVGPVLDEDVHHAGGPTASPGIVARGHVKADTLCLVEAIRGESK